MSFLLEVIASSVQDAVEAERGGADRVELCVSLDRGGLTPPLAMVREVVQSVGIPVRVMICEDPSYNAPAPEGRNRLMDSMREIGAMDVSGVVIGFAKGGEIDLDTMRDLMAVSPQTRITFHRVFERLRDPFESIRQLKSLPQVDRLLLCSADWDRLAQAAAPEITLVAGGGLREHDFRRLLQTTSIREFHTGRAVREQQKADGRVDARLVRELKQAIAA